MVLPAPSKLPVAFVEERLGDQFLYRLREPVTLERGSVLIIPLARRRQSRLAELISFEGSASLRRHDQRILSRNWERVRGKGQPAAPSESRGRWPKQHCRQGRGACTRSTRVGGGSSCRRQRCSASLLVRRSPVPSDSAPPVYAHRRTIDFKDERDSARSRYSGLNVKAIMVTVEYRIFNEGDSSAAAEIVESA